MFKIPESIPQDLLLILGLVDDPPAPTSSVGAPQVEVDCIDSSDSDTGSDTEAEEIEAVLLSKPEQEITPTTSDSVSDSSDDSDSDDSDGSDEKIPDLKEEEDVEDDEEPDARAAAGGTVFLTKNEVPETDIHVPEIEEVDPEETLEKVGQVMSIVENTVIVKGHAAEVQGKASERALDSETLLVFEDRKVLGYIYETFGPTSQPLYQVKFNHARPVDPERIWIAREVFHVPQRSNFVFLSQIRHLRGSDASNLHDEEPAEDELEFSDDEKEAASKSLRKRKRADSRAGSVASSLRPSTPTPSQMRDHELAEASFVNDPYADFPGPSRPPPIPYDDPYSDSYNFIGEPQAVSLATGEQLEPNVEPTPERPDDFDLPHRGSPKDKRPLRGRGRGRLDHRDRDGGHRNTERGRGRGRGRGDHGHHPYTGPRRHSSSKPPHSEPHHYQPPVYQSPAPRQMSPTSMAIARATGEYESSGPPLPDRRVGSSWAVSPTYPPAAYNQPYVQPHINPRFASAYAGYYQSSSYDQYGARPSEDWHGPSQGNWTDEWTVRTSPQEERETRPERQ